MLNYIWLGLVLCAVLIGGWNGQLAEVTDACLKMANKAVIEIAFAPLLRWQDAFGRQGGAD